MIKIHIFTCVLAYRMCCLLIKELADKGIETNINKLIDEMTQIKIIETFLVGVDEPEKVVSLTRGSEFAEKVLSLYKLKEKYI
jgi:hypothetical protein